MTWQKWKLPAGKGQSCCYQVIRVPSLLTVSCATMPSPCVSHRWWYWQDCTLEDAGGCRLCQRNSRRRRRSWRGDSCWWRRGQVSSSIYGQCTCAVYHQSCISQCITTLLLPCKAIDLSPPHFTITSARTLPAHTASTWLRVLSASCSRWATSTPPPLVAPRRCVLAGKSAALHKDPALYIICSTLTQLLG
jgi:hypothetical protein